MSVVPENIHMNYFPFHIGDYAVHTRHLSLMEDLAYRRLLDLYYTREKPLPAAFEDVARLVGMKEHGEAVDAVLAEFFELGPDGWTHTRCDEELSKMRAKQDNARASAAKRSANAPDSQANRKRDASEQEAIATNTNTNTKKEKQPSAVRTRRCPESFKITEDMLSSMAIECPGIDLDIETRSFRDWEFKDAKSDWPAAWRGWMRKAFKDRRDKPSGETAYQRSMRERATELHPAIARSAPGRPKPNPMEILDGLTVARIAG